MPSRKENVGKLFSRFLESEYKDSLLTCIAVANAVSIDDKVFQVFADQMKERGSELPDGIGENELRDAIQQSVAIVSLVHRDDIMDAKEEGDVDEHSPNRNTNSDGDLGNHLDPRIRLY